MKPKSFARLFPLAFAAACLLAAPAARAQEEGVPKVVDEVIAQVNTEVITLSMLRQEMKDAAGALAQAKGIPLEQAQAEIAKRQTEMIVTLINEQLLVQKGKELGFADGVEKEVNGRMLEVMKQEGLKTIEQLEQAMRNSGVDPAAVRQQLRAEVMKQAVLQNEVNSKLYWGLTESELKNYYAAHQGKFAKPETFALSEIFLVTKGKDEAEVRARAQQIVAQLRGGADFAATAKVTSERVDEKGERVAVTTGGKLGNFSLEDISNPEVLAAVRNLKVGSVSDPIKLPDGFIILRADGRTPAGAPAYDERKARELIANERLDKERKNYLAGLRRDAYVEVSPAYREQVMPLLGAPAPAAAATPAATGKKKEDKKAEKSPEKSPEKSYANGAKKP
ncbi:MAG: peptidyl-prolyl cis-trans isomerase [Acidobacteria bacterium]|nr:peptidyl-prolyl cis-trans isomerase [Acidobacteriota bacterium]MCA1641365.1 peptidyl-prolyl cis-trans isomerase [Acidobacteriota bacterium]